MDLIFLIVETVIVTPLMVALHSMVAIAKPVEDPDLVRLQKFAALILLSGAISIGLGLWFSSITAVACGGLALLVSGGLGFVVEHS